jgi:hypothetical protein
MAKITYLQWHRRLLQQTKESKQPLYPKFGWRDQFEWRSSIHIVIPVKAFTVAAPPTVSQSIREISYQMQNLKKKNWHSNEPRINHDTQEGINVQSKCGPVPKRAFTICHQGLKLKWSRNGHLKWVTKFGGAHLEECMRPISIHFYFLQQSYEISLIECSANAIPPKSDVNACFYLVNIFANQGPLTPNV